jgi:transposase InsO family protein
MEQRPERPTDLNLQAKSIVDATVALWFAYYNFCRVHMTLGRTPAMAAGLAEKPWTVSDLVC